MSRASSSAHAAERTPAMRPTSIRFRDVEDRANGEAGTRSEAGEGSRELPLDGVVVGTEIAKDRVPGLPVTNRAKRGVVANALALRLIPTHGPPRPDHLNV